MFRRQKTATRIQAGLARTVLVETCWITTGLLESGTIDGDMNGLIEASGQGEIDYLSIGGDLAGDVQAPEDSDPDSGGVGQNGIGGDVLDHDRAARIRHDRRRHEWPDRSERARRDRRSLDRWRFGGGCPGTRRQ